MPIDIREIVLATTAMIAPFTPFLVEAGKTGGKKLAEVIAEKGGEEVWKKAQLLWRKIKSQFGNNSEVQSAVTLLAAKPDDGNRQAMLAQVLTSHIEENPSLAQEFFDLLGGQESIQLVLADHSTWVEGVTQQLKGTGKQIVQADNNSVIKGVRQTKV